MCGPFPATWATLIRAWAASTDSTPPVCKGFERVTAVGRRRALRYVPPSGAKNARAEGANASMARVSVAEGTRLSVFLARGLLGRVTSRVTAHPIVNWPFSFGKADRIAIAPQDLRTSDATRASEIYAGRFAFAGKVVTCDSRSPFEMAPPSEDWAAALFGFSWLRHLRAAQSGITRANARALVDEWITLNRSHDPIAWRADVVARRVMSWLSQAPLVLDGADAQFYRRFLRSLTRQVRHLRHTAWQARDGVPRLQAAIALAYAALCMARQHRHIRAATKRLSDELSRQILADGGHISRNPGALIELLIDLLPLRSVFTARNLVPPAALLNAIDRMMPMLRFFRHGDGNFALFNGMGPTPTDLLTTILAYDDARGAPLANAPHSGYQRLETAGTLVLMDAGRPPPMAVSQEAHAGCLSFELSAKQNRIVVNCGLPVAGREGWRQVARTARARSPSPARTKKTASCCARRTTVTPTFSTLSTSACSRSPPTDAGSTARTCSRRRGRHRCRRTAISSPCASPASVGQGQPAVRRAQRHAGDAEQGGVDVQRLRGPRRHRGERLPRRPGRTAPHGAARYLRPCPQHDARAVDLCPARRARHGTGRRPPRSR